MKTNELTKAQRMVNIYSRDACLKAYQMHEEGNGAKTIGEYLKVVTNTADALINAGRTLTNQNK